ISVSSSSSPATSSPHLSSTGCSYSPLMLFRSWLPTSSGPMRPGGPRQSRAGIGILHGYLSAPPDLTPATPETPPPPHRSRQTVLLIALGAAVVVAAIVISIVATSGGSS